MTPYRNPGELPPKCTACDATIDRQNAYFDTLGNVVCDRCHFRRAATEASERLALWSATRPPNPAAPTVVIASVLFVIVLSFRFC